MTCDQRWYKVLGLGDQQKVQIANPDQEKILAEPRRPMTTDKAMEILQLGSAVQLSPFTLQASSFMRFQISLIFLSEQQPESSNM